MRTYIKVNDPNFEMGTGYHAYYKVSHYDQNNKFTHYTWQKIDSRLYGIFRNNFKKSKVDLMEIEVDEFNILDNEENGFYPEQFIFDDCY